MMMHHVLWLVDFIRFSEEENILRGFLSNTKLTVAYRYCMAIGYEYEDPVKYQRTTQRTR
jgi:hypothetical protein